MGGCWSRPRKQRDKIKKPAHNFIQDLDSPNFTVEGLESLAASDTPLVFNLDDELRKMDDALIQNLATHPSLTAVAAKPISTCAPSAEILTALDERLASVQSVEPPPTAANVAPHDRLFNWIRDPRSTELPPGADPDAGAALNADVRLALTALDDRLVKVLEAGDIRFVRSSWLLAQSEAYRIQKRQDLEALEQSGASPLLSPTEAVALVRKGNRSAGILSYGCALCHGLQPKQPLAFSSCVLPVFPAVC